MKDSVQKSHDGVHPVAAIAVGAAIGAGAAVAAKYALDDERTKKKVGEMFTSVKDQALDYIETVATPKLKTNGRAVIAEVKKEATKSANKKVL